MRAANSDFYRCLEAGDCAAMEVLWLDADATVRCIRCTHPGHPELVGRDQVMRRNISAARKN